MMINNAKKASSGVEGAINLTSALKGVQSGKTGAQRAISIGKIISGIGNIL